MKVSCILNFNGDIHVGGVNLGNVVNFNPSHDAARERYKGDDFSDSDMTEADFEDDDEEDKGNKKKASGITKLFLPHKRNIPKELKGEKAQQILKSLYEHGILDETSSLSIFLATRRVILPISYPSNCILPSYGKYSHSYGI